MAGTSRKGLKRHGMRAYVIEGPAGRFEIERDRPWRWLVRAAHIPRPFYSEQFRRLMDARRAAEQWAGVS